MWRPRTSNKAPRREFSGERKTGGFGIPPRFSSTAARPPPLSSADILLNQRREWLASGSFGHLYMRPSLIRRQKKTGDVFKTATGSTPSVLIRNLCGVWKAEDRIKASIGGSGELCRAVFRPSGGQSSSHRFQQNAMILI